MKTHSAKEITMNILNGLAIGTVVALVPGALLLELCKLLLPSVPSLQIVIDALTLCNSLVGVAIGVIIGMLFKWTPIQCVSLGLGVMYAGGAAQFKDGALLLKGTGDIINMGIAAALGVLLILLIADKCKAYSILVIPTLTVLVCGVIGRLLLPYVSMITTYVGLGVAKVLTLQPILMAILISMIFSVLIVSPLTTVGIALAISLSGIGSGAANVGICACGFGFAILGWTVNTKGTSIAHFVGSPKMSMANVIKKPKILLPIIASAAVCGLIADLLGIIGTPMSAGFGFSGLVGPLNYINLVEGGWTLMNIIKMFVAFLIAPVFFGFVFKFVFFKLIPVVKAEDYKLNI